MNYEMFEELLNEFCQDCNVANKKSVIISEFNERIVSFIWCDKQGRTHKRIYDYDENQKKTIVEEVLNLPW